MAKSLEELLADLERKAKERMGKSPASNETGATVYESNATVPESAATVYEGDATVPEERTEILYHPAVSESASGVYEKGQTILDTYTVESSPIHGGMGSVWRVHHKGWNVDLAMKRPQAKLFQSERQKENFILECEAWINLGLHPNIVSCYYVREIDGVPTIFSEWMENGSLENHIQKGTLYTGSEQQQQERLLDIAIQFARGLHYAHEQGLIHQDVKPDNVLLTEDWDAKVADFGLAKARAQLTVLEGENTSLDAGATVMAPSGGYTPAYCSMEQMDGKPLTRRTDIYSWAVSVMEMYLGERLWDNGVVAGLSCQDYLCETRVPVPDALRELLAKCMAIEAEERPHDFAELEDELKKIYRAATGSDYLRPVPTAAADTADSLNNRALSYLDIGKSEEAARLWETALKLSPNHPDSTFNRGLFQWRSGKINDVDFREQLMLYNKNNNNAFEEQIGLFKTERADVHRYAVESLEQFPLCKERMENPHCVSEDGRFMLLKDGSAPVLRDVHNGEIIRRYDRSNRTCALRPDGTVAALTFRDSDREPCVDLVPLQGTPVTVHLSDDDRDAPLTMAFSHNGKNLYVGMNYGAFLKVSTDGRIEAKTKPIGYRLESLFIDDPGQQVIVGASNGEVYILDSHDLTILHTIRSNGDGLLSVEKYDGKIIVFGKKTVRIIDEFNRKCLTTIELTDWIDESPDIVGGWVDSDGTINVCHKDEVLCFTYSAPKAAAPYMLSRIQTSSQRRKSDDQFAKYCEEAVGLIECGDSGKALELLEKARAIIGYESDQRLLDLNERAGIGHKKIGIRGLYPRGTFDGRIADYSTETHSIYIGARFFGGLIKADLVTGQSIQSENRMTNNEERNKICVGNRFVACTYGKQLNILDLSDCRRRHTFELSPRINPHFFTSTLKYCPEKNILMVGTSEGIIKLWDTVSWECIWELDTGIQECLTADINDQATMVLAAGDKDRLKIFDIRTTKAITDISLPNDGKVHEVWDAAFSGERVIVGRRWYFIQDRYGDRVDIYNIQSMSLAGDDLKTLEVVPFGKMLEALPESDWLACSHDGEPDFVFFTSDGSKVQKFKLFQLEEGYEMSNIRFSFDGRYIAAWAAKGYDGKINLWEIDWIYE